MWDRTIINFDKLSSQDATALDVHLLQCLLYMLHMLQCVTVCYTAPGPQCYEMTWKCHHCKREVFVIRLLVVQIVLNVLAASWCLAHCESIGVKREWAQREENGGRWILERNSGGQWISQAAINFLICTFTICWLHNLLSLLPPKEDNPSCPRAQHVILPVNKSKSKLTSPILFF